MKFIKMHGTGNDFIMIDNREGKIKLTQMQIAKMCERHFGIGADGLILVESGHNGGDAFMNYHNADGTTAEMCGNGTRCVAHFVKEFWGFKGDSLQLETRSGIKPMKYLEHDLYQVNMGKPVWEHSDLPKTAPSYEECLFYPVSMGNPHAVGIYDSEKAVDVSIQQMGLRVESDRINFPNKTNVNFVYPIAENHFGVKTYERGVGPTLACGTGASGSFSVLKKLEKIKGRTILDVPGGSLYFEWNREGEVLMSGPSEIVFEGMFYL